MPAVYAVKTEVKGFQSVMRSAIELQIQQTARIDFRLQVGQVTEVVEVSSTPLRLATENATLGTVIDNKRIVELPLNGRNYLQLVALNPNVSFGFAPLIQSVSRQGGDRPNWSISVAGKRSEFNYYTLDGVSNTDACRAPAVRSSVPQGYGSVSMRRWDEAEDQGVLRRPCDFHLATSDSQSCSTTSAELSPGVIEGITKRLPSGETSNETTE